MKMIKEFILDTTIALCVYLVSLILLAFCFSTSDTKTLFEFISTAIQLNGSLVIAHLNLSWRFIRNYWTKECSESKFVHQHAKLAEQDRDTLLEMLLYLWFLYFVFFCIAIILTCLLTVCPKFMGIRFYESVQEVNKSMKETIYYFSERKIGSLDMVDLSNTVNSLILRTERHKEQLYALFKTAWELIVIIITFILT